MKEAYKTRDAGEYKNSNYFCRLWGIGDVINKHRWGPLGCIRLQFQKAIHHIRWFTWQWFPTVRAPTCCRLVDMTSYRRVFQSCHHERNSPIRWIFLQDTQFQCTRKPPLSRKVSCYEVCRCGQWKASCVLACYWPSLWSGQYVIILIRKAMSSYTLQSFVSQAKGFQFTFSTPTRYTLGIEPGTPVEPLSPPTQLSTFSRQSTPSPSELSPTRASTESSLVFLQDAPSLNGDSFSPSCYSNSGSDADEHGSNDIYLPDSPTPQPMHLSMAIPPLSPSNESLPQSESTHVSPPVTPPPSTSVKQGFSDWHTTTPSSSPQKKKTKALSVAVAATVKVTKNSPLKGLYRFFSKGISQEERREQVKRANEEVVERWEREREREETAQHRKDEKRREKDNIRKCESQKRHCEEEIKAGERSPGGTKQQVRDQPNIYQQLTPLIANQNKGTWQF